MFKFKPKEKIDKLKVSHTLKGRNGDKEMVYYYAESKTKVYLMLQQGSVMQKSEIKNKKNPYEDFFNPPGRRRVKRKNPPGYKALSEV